MSHERSPSGLLSIGSFSRASLLSIKMLRAYHEAGILVPAQVDPRTGYRAYQVSQLTDAAVVRRLRQVDLPLDQVGEVVRAADPEVTRQVLAQHQATMQARLEEVARAVNELTAAVERPASHTPVHVRWLEATPVLALRGKVTEADFAAFLDEAYQDLGRAVGRLHVEPAGPAGALYPPEISDEVEEVEAFLPLPELLELPDDLASSKGLAGGGDGLLIHELPPATVAVAVHTGGYESMGETYRVLGAWVAEHATPADLPVREIYTVSYGETDDTDRFRTEIQWPVAD